MLKKIYLENLSLLNYRNFSKSSLQFQKGINFIIGENGSGKTNILESISLLSIGRGLKSANFGDIINNSKTSWNISVELHSKLGPTRIQSEFARTNNKRTTYYNGSKIATSELSKFLNIVWLTPQMCGIFLETPAYRRKFLDRIIYNIDELHAKRVIRYDYFTRQRNRILLERNLSNSNLLDSIEEKMSEDAYQIYQARRDVINLMQTKIDMQDTSFTKAKLASNQEEDYQSKDFISFYRDSLAKFRKKDLDSGRVNFGVSKMDLIVSHGESDRNAKLCSTGEQKALLISIILASIEFILQNTQSTPILLLDELFTHLDQIRTKQLTEYIIKTNLQTFITATDIIFAEETNDINIIKI